MRNVRDRLTKLAPFLSYDGDPYPVVVDGRVLWVVDGYTSTSHYPYAQRVGDSVQLTPSSGISRDANYIRNSVKAVVDAYAGAVDFYVVDPDDPIVQAWQGAFGDLFSPKEDMPPELADHLRYPEDLFRVQTDVYSKYRLAPADFFQREGAWSVAQAPSVDPSDDGGTVPTPAGDRGRAGAGPGRGRRHGALRAVLHDVPLDDRRRPGPPTTKGRKRTRRRRRRPTQEDAAGATTEHEFVLLRPYVPFSSNDLRTELSAYMTASSDADTYGRLVAYVVNSPPTIEGPRTVANQIDSAPAVTRQISDQTAGNTGNQVRFGDLQLVPIADGLLYVRPMYASVQQSSGNSVTEYRFITVAHDGRAAIGASLGEALGNLFPGFEGDLGDRVGAAAAAPTSRRRRPSRPWTRPSRRRPSCWPPPTTCSPKPTTPSPPATSGEYQSKIDEAQALVQQALDLLQVDTTPTSAPPTTTD